MLNICSGEERDPHNGTFHILLTANTFQNCHSFLRNDHLGNLALLKDVLESESIVLYMTEYDRDILEIFRRYFRPFRTAIIYDYLLSKIRIIKLPISIGEETQLYSSLSAMDALRVAVSIDFQIDSIVTWEPQNFIVNDIESAKLQLEQCGYFEFNVFDLDNRILLNNSESNSDEWCLRVYSVRSFRDFLMGSGYLTDDKNDTSDSIFSVEKVSISFHSNNGDPRYIASVRLRHGRHGRLEAESDSYIDNISAIKDAIDTIVDSILDLPPREIESFSIESDVETIVPLQSLNCASIYCSYGNGSEHYVNSDINPWKAIANCYCRFINDYITSLSG